MTSHWTPADDVVHLTAAPRVRSGHVTLRKQVREIKTPDPCCGSTLPRHEYRFLPPANAAVVTHPVASVCLAAFNPLTVEILDLKSSFFGIQVHILNRQVKLLYKGHLIKVKVNEPKSEYHHS